MKHQYEEETKVTFSKTVGCGSGKRIKVLAAWPSVIAPRPAGGDVACSRRPVRGAANAAPGRGIGGHLAGPGPVVDGTVFVIERGAVTGSPHVLVDRTPGGKPTWLRALGACIL